MTKMIRTLTRSEDELHEAAIRKTGFDDFGDPAYRQGLRVLLKAFDTDLQLTETGWQCAYGIILRTLIARLYAQKGWTQHPEVLAIPIHVPVVITGLPRTGTTALHRLLSLDPQFQGMEFWLAETPMVRPPRNTWETYSAFRDCVTNLKEMYIRMPERRKVHETVASEVEECTAVLMQSFLSGVWSVVYSLPTYARWLPLLSERESYRRYVDILRLISAREPHKRWLLKSPYHMLEIDALLEVFPDACIIQTHRDPLEVIPSCCSLAHMYRQDFEGEAARADVLGPLQCTQWRKALDRMKAARQRSPMRLIDVDHRRFLSNPLGIVHSIYDYFSLTLSRHAEQQMRAWIAGSPTSRHGKHQYTLDSWGVTPAQICDAFADYRAHHQFN